MGYIKGQNLRLFITKGAGLQCVAAATSCTLHTAANTEDASTKDDTGDWGATEVTGLTWDISCDSLMPDTTSETANTVQDIWDAFVAKKPVAIAVQATKGDKNRTADTDGLNFTGNAILRDLSISAQNKQNATLSIQLEGVGELALA